MSDLKSSAAIVTHLPVLMLGNSITAEAPTLVSGLISSFASVCSTEDLTLFYLQNSDV